MIQQGSTKTTELKLDDFLRIVDVATAVRQKQEEVNRQLDINEVKTELKKKLQDTAKVTGESLSDPQIDMAVNSYFQGLYSFQVPERAFGTKLAELYVERRRLAKKYVAPPLVVAAAGGVIWLSAIGISSASHRIQTARFNNLVSKTESLYGDITAIAKEKEALQKGEELYKEAKQLIISHDSKKLSQSVSQLENLDGILEQEYTSKIVSRSGVKSGIDRYYTDASGKRVSGYYLIVEAVSPRGETIPVYIRNEEDGRTERVRMWGERVPEQVYERVKNDKLDDGIINNDTVGKKQKGYLTEEITMPGVTKQGQITRW